MLVQLLDLWLYMCFAFLFFFIFCYVIEILPLL